MLVRYNYKPIVLTSAVIFLYCIFQHGENPKEPLIRNSFNEYLFDDDVNTINYSNDYRIQSLNRNSLSQLNNKVVLPRSRHIETSKVHKILVFTKVFESNRFCNIENNEKVFLDECPYKNCQFTCDRTEFREASAVLFSEFDLRREDTEITYEIKNFWQRTNERNGQVWILWNDEPNISDEMNQFTFNWTMSYRFDSEVSDCSYGCTYSRVPNQFKTHKKDEILKRKFSLRSRMALWAVSNCKATTRMNFALQLSKHFSLTVLGKCGKNFGANFANSTAGVITKSNCNRNSPCEISLFNKSKFYLSFESVNCTDYLTEKLWRILRTGMIPVVLQPNKANYIKIAPPGSFIHAEDFDFDAERLATYLNKVSLDFNEYRKYHLWKHEFNVVYSGVNTEKRRMCELCTKLNSEKSVIYYRKIAGWFNEGCRR